MNPWPDSDQILTCFRQWLSDAHAEAESVSSDVAPDSVVPDGVAPRSVASDDGELAAQTVGLIQLVEQFTALRHELKLQTKSARSLEERSEATLTEMHAAIEQFRSVQADENQAAQRAARPLVEALIDLDEALQRGRKVIENAQRRIVEESVDELKKIRERLDEVFQLQSWWRRKACRPWHEATKEIYFHRAIEMQRGIFASLLEGYSLIQSRLQRFMDEEKIIRIPCVGQPADPHAMTVIEVIDDPTKPAGAVVEEIRPGYFWKGKVVRFAEVRANQGALRRT